MKIGNAGLAALIAIAPLAFGTSAGTAAAASPSALPSSVSDALLAALEDEYHAEAFYAAVLEQFGPARPFSNIVQAERSHEQALVAVMNMYNVPVPANTQLGSAEIAAAVPATLADACRIGVQAEIENAALYDEQLLPTVQDYQDIVVVMQFLSDASTQKHLRAFQRCAN